MRNLLKYAFLLSLLGFLFVWNHPSAQAEWKGCASPSETCARLSELLDKAVHEQNLSYCDAIVTKNLSAMLKQPFSDENVSGNPSELQGECYGMALHGATQQEMCFGLGVRGLCAGSPQGCESHLANLRQNCFLNLALNTQTSKYCAFIPDAAFLHNPTTRASCYYRSGGLFWAIIYGSSVGAFQLKESVAFFFGALGQSFFGTTILGLVGLYVIYLILIGCIAMLTRLTFKLIKKRKILPAILAAVFLIFLLVCSVLFWLVDVG